MRSYCVWCLAGIAVLSVLGPVLAQGGQRGGTLRVALEGDPPTMDPHRSGAVVERQVYQNLYDKLMDTDADLAIVPMLATSWTVSPDGRSVTFKLRQGVTFHDGTPFNAEAVKYNVQRMLDPTFPSVRRSEIKPVKEVVVVDPSTVQFVMERPYSPLLYVLTDRAGMMLSPAAAQKDGLNFSLHPVGTGAFRFVEKVPQDHITLERNPNYWTRGLPYLDRLIFRTIVDDNARVANVKSGDIEMISGVPLPQVTQLAKESARPGARIRLLEHGAFEWDGMSLNTTRPPFDSKLLRQAFSATIDREAIANAVLQGAAYPANSFFPTGTPAYDPTWRVPARNLSVAREKLREAGRPDGFEFTVLATAGQQRQAVAQALQAMAADVGIRMKIQIVETGALGDSITRLQHQAALMIWSGRPDPDFDIYPFVTPSGIGALNFAGYANPKVEEMLDSARYLNNMAQRRRVYHEVTKILADDEPYVILYFPKEYKLVSTRVRGFVHVPDGMLRLRTVWLAP